MRILLSIVGLATIVTAVAFFGRGPAPAAASGVAAVDAGGLHTCALTTAGGVNCWGVNRSGQLGDGTSTGPQVCGPFACSTTPVAVSGLASGVAAVSAGESHTCAVTTAGGLKCWGMNFFGQLGAPTTETCFLAQPCSTTPVNVSGLASGVAAVTAGFSHTCALTTAGGLKCWGFNGTGQLGDGTTTQRTTPVDVSGLASGVAAVAAGGSHTCALTTAGGVKCWGANGAGELGDGQGCGIFFCTTPVNVSGLASGVAAVAAGYGHTCALTTGGGVKCWGASGNGQLGDGQACGFSFSCTTPVNVTGLGSGVAAVIAGFAHTCALTAAGAVKCWGNNAYGQLGDGTTTQRLSPVDVSGLALGVAAVSAGDDHTCALTTAGGVKCWGANHFGMLGDGTTALRTTPVEVSSAVKPPPLGGVAAYPDLSSGQNAGLVAGAIAALAASAVALGGAAWYGRRKRLE